MRLYSHCVADCCDLGLSGKKRELFYSGVRLCVKPFFWAKGAAQTPGFQALRGRFGAGRLNVRRSPYYIIALIGANSEKPGAKPYAAADKGRPWQ